LLAAKLVGLLGAVVSPVAVVLIVSDVEAAE